MIDKGGVKSSHSSKRINPMNITNIYFDLNTKSPITINKNEKEMVSSNANKTKQHFNNEYREKTTKNIQFIHTHCRFNLNMTDYFNCFLNKNNVNEAFKHFYQSNIQWGTYNEKLLNNNKQKIITLNLNNSNKQNNNLEIQQLNYLQKEGHRSIPIQSLKLYVFERQKCRWNSNQTKLELTNSKKHNQSKMPLNIYKSPSQREMLIKTVPFLLPQSYNFNNNSNSNRNNINNVSAFPGLKDQLHINHQENKDKTVIESPNKHIKDKTKENNRLIDDFSYYHPKLFNYYIIHPENCGYLIKRSLYNRTNWKESQSLTTQYFNFQWKDSSIGINYNQLSTNTIFFQCVNHFEYHSVLSNKANMFYNLMQYCEENNREVFQYIPFTIVLTHDGSNIYDLVESFKQIYDNITNYLYDYDEIKLNRFSRKNTSYHSLFSTRDSKLGLRTYVMISRTHHDTKNLWIIKVPNLNRGRGIKLISSFDSVNKYIKQIISGKLQDYTDENDKKIEGIDNQMQYQSNKIVIQKYVEKPLLYYNRKFDIRVWVLITHKLEVYAFREGHLKICSVDYNCNDNNAYVHLTNYSLQKYNQDFSKYEKGNEVSFELFQEYLDAKYSDRDLSIKEDFFIKYKEIIELTCRSIKAKINPKNRKYCFEIFGYDFLMDIDFNTYLIEINTNPGLEDSSEIIKCLIPRMLDDALRLTIDEIYPMNYRKECIDSNINYISPYKVKGYSDKENMWEYVCDLNKSKDKKVSIKKKKTSKKKVMSMIPKYNINI